jgi:hypothetical protein
MCILYTDGETKHPALVLDTAVVDEAGCVLETVCHLGSVLQLQHYYFMHTVQWCYTVRTVRTQALK